MEEYKGGALLSPYDERDWHIDRCLDMPTGSDAVTLPKKFSVSYLPPIRNQEKTASCTAFAMAGILSCIYYKKFGEEVNYSTGFLYGNRLETGYKDEGQFMNDVISTTKKHGDIIAEFWDNNLEVPEAIDAFLEAYPKWKEYAHKLIKGYVRIRDKQEAKAFLVKYDIPLFVNTRVKKVHPLMNAEGYHALMCTGWLSNGYFKHQNSWGENNCPRPEIEFDDLAEVWGIIPNIDTEFTDITKDRWSYDSISLCAKYGIIAGYPDGTYQPEKTPTREEVAAIAARLIRLIEEKDKT